MRVKVTLYGELRRYLNGGSAEVEAPEGATVEEVLAGLGVDPAHPRIAAVNDETVDETQALQDGDTMEVFHAVAGGGAGDQGWR